MPKRWLPASAATDLGEASSLTFVFRCMCTWIHSIIYEWNFRIKGLVDPFYIWMAIDKLPCQPTSSVVDLIPLKVVKVKSPRSVLSSGNGFWEACFPNIPTRQVQPLIPLGCITGGSRNTNKEQIPFTCWKGQEKWLLVARNLGKRWLRGSR